MCGIAGQIAPSAAVLDQRQAACAAMQQALRRRGPDQQGAYRSGRAALLHTRLAIVDLEGGRQPMTLAWRGERYALVYNGELYNTPELRAGLEALGHRFGGWSDTEVLLHAYAEWGAACLGRCNGIFAFAVWEEKAERLFLARDRIGVKPLFYALAPGEGLVFASELGALTRHPAAPPRVDAAGLAEVLLLGPGRTPGCGVYQGVRELRPGECALYAGGRLTLRRYWQLEDHEHPHSFEQTVRRLRELVVDAITRQLVSDVPVAAMLSGGLDSSIIAAVADRAFAAEGRQLHTYSVGYRDNRLYYQATKFQPGPDAPYIRLMNRCLHAEHHWVTLDVPELAEALAPAADARGLPGMADVDASLLLFCRQIRQGAAVALSGECADELFGGYPWFRDESVRPEAGFPWAQSTAYRASFLKPGVLGGIDPAAFVGERCRRTLAEASVRPGLPPAEARMRRMFALNFDWFMQTLLDRKDRMSMYSGLEVRVPFCDWRIASYMYSVPWAYKDWQGREKGLLREAMRGLLPEQVLWRKKSPYPKTWHPAYLAAVSARLRAVIADPAAPLLRVVRKDALEALLAGAGAGAAASTPWYGQLMTTPQTIAWFLQLDHWLAGVELV